MTGFLGGDPPPWCASGIGRKFFYDLAKISFTALVVGSVVSVATQQEKVENWVLILIGIFVTYIFSYIGYKIIKQ